MDKHLKIKTVFINGRFLVQRTTGVQRYAIELVKTLDALIDEGKINTSVNLVLLAPKAVLYKIPLKRISFERVGRMTGYLWEQIELPYYSRSGLLVNLCNTAPLLKVEQMVTIHDASIFAYPDSFSLPFLTWYRTMLPTIGNNSRIVVTDSEFSKRELMRYCGFAEAKIRVIYCGVDHVLSFGRDYSVLREHGLLDEPYVLTVGSLDPRKNVLNTMRAMSILGDAAPNIVIAGGGNSSVFAGQNLPRLDSAKYLGHIGDAALRVLYENAACFVYPSFYEGFGFPPLEAMSCGCPVIVSDRSSLPEVCGNASLYCDPDDPRDIADKIALLLADESLRKELKAKGLLRAREFEWKTAAGRMLTLFDGCLS